MNIYHLILILSSVSVPSFASTVNFSIHEAFTSARYMDTFPDKIDITPQNAQMIQKALELYHHDEVLTQYYEIDTNFYAWGDSSIEQTPSSKIFRLGKPSWIIANNQLIKARCKESYNRLCEHHYLDDRHPHWNTLLPQGYLIQSFTDIADLLEKIKEQPQLKIYVDYTIEDDHNAEWRFFSRAKLRLAL